MAARSAPNLGAPAAVAAAETRNNARRSALGDADADDSVGGDAAGDAGSAVHVASQARATEGGFAGAEDREMRIRSGGEAQGTTEACEGETRMRRVTLFLSSSERSSAAEAEFCRG
jgi:hypothetical protein